jgi:erythromycin esterase
MRPPTTSWHLAALFTVASLLLTGCSDIIENLADDGESSLPARTATMVAGQPSQWFGTQPGQFEIGTDYGVQRSGRASVYILTRTRAVFGDQFGVLNQSVRADAYRGSRVRLSGWLRTSAVTGQGARLWLRSDGAAPQAFDNMNDRPLVGTAEWREVSIVADIPENAIGIIYGVMMVSPGVVWADDLKLEIVGTDVPVTASTSTFEVDTAATARGYDRIAMGPRNLDFEGVIYPAGIPDAVSWVTSKSFPFATDDPAVPSSDLDPLRTLVGNATIVALGEATHGTREFFRMKHRMLEWLVREMGFSYFGIEATFPEALDVDHYVQTGEGDPADLLANLHFWTWNTTEVLDLIKWMRAWNASGKQPTVHFVGFDMQFPGVALDSVEAFATRIDAVTETAVRGAYHCLDQFRTYPTITGSAGIDVGYRKQTPAYQRDCRVALQQVDTLLARNESAWAAREGATKMRLVRRMARLVSQWEAANAQDVPAGSNLRDLFMAENTAWWHDTYAPGSKMVLWAHNMHISKIRGWMGDHLSKRYGAGYLNVGQTFGTGSFNALLGIPAPDTLPSLRSHTLITYRDESIESVFLGTKLPRLIFDARRARTENSASTATLSLPMSIRAIGAVFNPRIPTSGYAMPLNLKHDYDLIVWFETTTASGLLTFEPPVSTRRW